MKKSVFFSALLGVALAVGVSGCKHGPVKTIHIPGAKPPTVDVPAPTGPSVPDQQPTINVQPVPEPSGPTVSEPTKPTSLDMPSTGAYVDLMNGKHSEDYDTLAKDTVYFDTDSSAVKKSEQEKLEDAAKYMKNCTEKVGLQVQGHCDERGTEGYNQSLGERRALAVREYLINLGVPTDKLGTISFGESKPADPGHNEAAWKKNRRGLLVLIKEAK